MNKKENENREENSQCDGNELARKDEKKNRSVTTWLIAAGCVLALTLCGALYIASPKKAGQEVESRDITLTDAGFDTPISFKTTCSEEDFNKYVTILKDTFVECNQIFDAYQTYPDTVSLMQVNQDGHDQPVTVDERVIEVYNDALKAHQINPKFDVSQGKLIALWKEQFDAQTPALPSEQAIQDAINPESMNAVKVEGDTIQLMDEEAALDFGAIAKGYTAQLAADRLQEAGLEFGFINAGGNVVLIGEKPDGNPWVVGIQNPDESDSLLTYKTQTPTCLVTSGDYQRYMTVDGKRYSHIIDPQTGYPENFMRSVTVIHTDSAYCDAMSTALFCMSVEDGQKLCADSDLDAVWITDKGSVDLEPDFTTDAFDIYVTPGIKDQITIKNAQ